MKRKVITLLLAFSMVTGMVGCAGGEKATEKAETTESAGGTETVESAEKSDNGEEAVTLRVYTQYADADTKEPMDYAVEELKKVMPHVTLEIDVQAQDDGQKLKTYAATGDMPDIFNCGLDQINTFIKSGNIAVLNDYVETTGYDQLIQENCKDLLYHEDGNVYAFPYAGNEMVLMYYNQELFEKNNIKVPETYEELIEAVEKFNEVGITPISIFAQEGWITSAMYDVIATKYIPEGMKGLDKGTTEITDEGYLKAAQKLKELVDMGAFAKGATGLNYDQAASLFYQEEAAMFINGQWFITDADTNMAGKADWMLFPTLSDGGSNEFAISGAGNIGGHAVSSSTEDVELAAEVAAFISEKIAEYKYVKRANTIVAVKVDKPFECEVTPMIQKLSDEMPKFEVSSAFAWGLTNPKFKATLEEQTQALIAGTIEPEAFIEMLAQSLN